MAGEIAQYFIGLSDTLGVSLWLLVVILIWSIIWKMFALWKAARKGSVVWFIVLAIVNTIGILEILYLFVFSKIGEKKPITRTSNKRKSRSRRR